MKFESIQIFDFAMHALWLESPGIFDSRKIWAFYYPGYIHFHESLWGLFWEVVREYKHIKHMIG
jgi:hypothetical protein